jgi:hypothetical protein
LFESEQGDILVEGTTSGDELSASDDNWRDSVTTCEDISLWKTFSHFEVGDVKQVRSIGSDWPKMRKFLQSIFSPKKTVVKHVKAWNLIFRNCFKGLLSRIFFLLFSRSTFCAGL